MKPAEILRQVSPFPTRAPGMSSTESDRLSVHASVIKANVDFYKEIASTYDHYESCAFDGYLQRMLDDDLDEIARGLNAFERPIQCLDCGGGTGNLTLKMLKRGWDVTVVDISPDMLEILQSKVTAAGHSARFRNASIEEFLASTDQSFHVITFSSVLHHLFAPMEVLEQMAHRILPGGYFYSNFDPGIPSHPRWADCVSSLDTLVAKSLFDRSDILPGIARRIRKLGKSLGSNERAVVSAGDIAEYHARSGLDDMAIVASLERSGFQVQHKRYTAARTPFTRRLIQHLHACFNFRIIARRINS